MSVDIFDLSKNALNWHAIITRGESRGIGLRFGLRTPLAFARSLRRTHCKRQSPGRSVLPPLPPNWHVTEDQRPMSFGGTVDHGLAAASTSSPINFMPHQSVDYDRNPRGVSTKTCRDCRQTTTTGLLHKSEFWPVLVTFSVDLLRQPRGSRAQKAKFANT